MSQQPVNGPVIERPAILSLSAPALEGWLEEHGAPAYRRKQLWGWMARGAASFDEIRDIPKPLRAELDREFRITSLRAHLKKLVDDRKVKVRNVKGEEVYERSV